MNSEHFNSSSRFRGFTLKEVFVAALRISKSSENQDIPWYKDIKPSDIEEGIKVQLVYQLAESQRAHNDTKDKFDSISCWDGAINRTVLSLDTFLDLNAAILPSEQLYREEFKNACAEFMENVSDEEKDDIIANYMVTTAVVSLSVYFFH